MALLRCDEAARPFLALGRRSGSRRKGKIMRVILAQPRGFCAGVVRAIDIVEKALDKFGEPVYVRHEIVHNKHAVSYTHLTLPTNREV